MRWTFVLLIFAANAVFASEPIDISGHRQLFVDDHLTETVKGKIALTLHHPTAREVALQFDQPWEGNASGYMTVLQDGDLYRMWYRGHRYLIDPPPLRQAQAEAVCYAESKDGVHWVKPKLGLFEWNKSKENNIVWLGGPEAHNFAPFLDTNPKCPKDQRFKAVGGTTTSQGLLTFSSADGIHWKKLSDKPVVTEGAFDSHNTCFWDADRERYAMYVRYFSEKEFRGLRSIGVAFSPDLATWTKPAGIRYGDSPPQQMYTNHVAPYYRAPHILFGFPTRFIARPLTEHAKRLEPVDTRAKFAASVADSGSYTGAEQTDGLFMTSRDGSNFHRWDEAFLRPGPQELGNWIYGDNYQAYGLLETKAALTGAPSEISLYFDEGAWRDDMRRLRRYTLRLDGFVSLRAGYAGGELITKPVKFSGKKLSVNYSTSAAGSLRVELQDAEGKPIPGYTLADADEHYGDSIAQTVTWKNSADVGKWSGQAVRLRFVLSDGDLYSFRFE